jgi:hypothetical protein
MSLNIVRIVESWDVRWARHIACMEGTDMIIAYRLLGRKLEGRRSLQKV